jgi:hypothetical protein
MGAFASFCDWNAKTGPHQCHVFPPIGSSGTRTNGLDAFSESSLHAGLVFSCVAGMKRGYVAGAAAAYDSSESRIAIGFIEWKNQW